MTRTRRCPRCTARIPEESARCTICGQEGDGGVVRAERFGGRRGRVAGAVLLLAVVVGLVGNADRLGRAIADSYASMVIGNLPEPAFRLVPMDADERAFYACARAISRRVGSESSIVTFASRTVAVTETLEDGSVQIRSYLDEAHESGPPRRHTFTCTLERQGERYTVADTEIALVDGSALAERGSTAR